LFVAWPYVGSTVASAHRDGHNARPVATGRIRGNLRELALFRQKPEFGGGLDAAQHQSHKSQKPAPVGFVSAKGLS